jgi:ArsR family transcriptional regulator, arsenate/arsenite/antimonite-responsive transcriptional repressor / arsenate reductase (thioredoxin)
MSNPGRQRDPRRTSDAERRSDLEQRAGMHAALGEPVRLAIVDRLILGDVSPGELGRDLALATNLLAHHLGVLEAAGLIRRVRSEGDRRRSYVQLVLDDPVVTALTRSADRSLAAANVPEPVQRVVFVCTQNSARSQLACAVWARASDVPSASAGTHPAARVHPRAVSVGRRHGLRLGRAKTASVADVVQPGDLIVAVCDNAHEELTAGPPSLHWAVPDPAPADTDRAFETAYAQITRRVDRLADAVHADAIQVVGGPPGHS